MTTEVPNLETLMNTVAYAMAESVITMIDAGESLKFIRASFQDLINDIGKDILPGADEVMQKVNKEFGY